jgi:hypothetical protein
MGLTLSISCGTAEPLRPASTPSAATVSLTQPITLNLCASEGGRLQDHEWKKPLLTSMTRVLEGVLAPGQTLKMRVGDCPPLFLEKTCYANPEFLACREEFIARLLQSAAWGGALSAIALQRHPDPRKFYDMMANVGGGDLFELVSATPESISILASTWQPEGPWTADEIIAAQALVDKIRLFESNAAQPSTPVEQIAEAVYITTAGHLMSFVIGHELSHYFADQCLFRDVSAERQGRIDAMRGLQEVGGPLCASVPAGQKSWIMTPRLEEMIADDCALRGMARLEQRTFSAMWAPPFPGAPSTTIGLVARRLVVDVLAWFLAYGPSSSGRADFGQDGNPEVIRASLLPGYLYPQHRLALVAAELGGHLGTGSPRSMICEDSGRIFALQSRAAISVCRSGKLSEIRDAEQQLADPLGAYVPEGIVKIWQTGQWIEPQSFHCEPQ